MKLISSSIVVISEFGLWKFAKSSEFFYFFIFKFYNKLRSLAEY